MIPKVQDLDSISFLSHDTDTTSVNSEVRMGAKECTARIFC